MFSFITVVFQQVGHHLRCAAVDMGSSLRNDSNVGDRKSGRSDAAQCPLVPLHLSTVIF